MPNAERRRVLDALEASGLRGRGGSWFPAHRKWRAVAAEDGRPFVVANGGESEPGSLKDRVLMRTKPADILDGLRIAMETLNAERGFVYLKGSFDVEERAIRSEIERAGLAGRVAVHRGDDTYVGGEETAALESIEGRRAWPRPKPPRPSSVGLGGRPTLVQNVDTLSRVQRAVDDPDGFLKRGELTVTVWGDVRSPGVYDVTKSSTILEALARRAGGLVGPPGLIFPNGVHAGPLDARAADVPLDHEALVAAGTALGSASILVLDGETCPVSVLHSTARFFARESCGQCPPCALGAANLLSLVTGNGASDRRASPDAALQETAGFMAMHGYCAHSPAGASVVSALFRRFRPHAAAHFAASHGGCPDGLRMRDPFARDSPELRALETAALR